jgi:hypothetical protein
VNKLALVDNSDLVKRDEETGLQYIPVQFSLKPIGGEDDADEPIFIPKIKILGSNSDEVKKKSAAYIPNAEEGMFFHTLTKQLYTNLNVVPLTSFTERYYSEGKMSKNMICMSRDGRGKYGLCASGDYGKHNIPVVKAEVDGIFAELGNCGTCPHSQRIRGEQSECNMVKYMVCAHLDFIKQWPDLAPKLVERDMDALLDIFQNMFLLPFKSSSLKIFSQMKRVIDFSGKYFNQSFEMSTFLDHNDSYEWHNYVASIDRILTPDEQIFAYSIMRLAKTVRRVLRDEDIEVLSEPAVRIDSGKETEVEEME